MRYDQTAELSTFVLMPRHSPRTAMMAIISRRVMRRKTITHDASMANNVSRKHYDNGNARRSLRRQRAIAAACETKQWQCLAVNKYNINIV